MSIRFRLFGLLDHRLVQSCDFGRTWLMIFKKRTVCLKLDAFQYSRCLNPYQYCILLVIGLHYYCIPSPIPGIRSQNMKREGVNASCVWLDWWTKMFTWIIDNVIITYWSSKGSNIQLFKSERCVLWELVLICFCIDSYMFSWLILLFIFVTVNESIYDIYENWNSTPNVNVQEIITVIILVQITIFVIKAVATK